MRAAIIFIICLFLHIQSACSEVVFGDLPLEGVSEQEWDDTLSDIVNISYFDSLDSIKYGEIYDVDIVDSKVLIATVINNITQIGVWDVYGNFLCGYEMLQTYHPIRATNRSFCLSTDGSTVLIYLRRGENIIGLTSHDGNPVVSVYATPTVVEKCNYVFPKRSSYAISDRAGGKVVVAFPDGTPHVVVDFSVEYTKYQSEQNTRILPYAIVILLLFSIFLCAIAWFIRNNTNDPSSPLL